MELSAHLEHLQIVLNEFNSNTAPTEEVMICFFCDCLKPSIQA